MLTDANARVPATRQRNFSPSLARWRPQEPKRAQPAARAGVVVRRPDFGELRASARTAVPRLEAGKASEARARAPAAATTRGATAGARGSKVSCRASMRPPKINVEHAMCNLSTSNSRRFVSNSLPPVQTTSGRIAHGVGAICANFRRSRPRSTLSPTRTKSTLLGQITDKLKSPQFGQLSVRMRPKLTGIDRHYSKLLSIRVAPGRLDCNVHGSSFEFPPPRLEIWTFQSQQQPTRDAYKGQTREEIAEIWLPLSQADGKEPPTMPMSEVERGIEPAPHGRRARQINSAAKQPSPMFFGVPGSPAAESGHNADHPFSSNSALQTALKVRICKETPKSYLCAKAHHVAAGLHHRVKPPQFHNEGIKRNRPAPPTCPPARSRKWNGSARCKAPGHESASAASGSGGALHSNFAKPLTTPRRRSGMRTSTARDRRPKKHKLCKYHCNGTSTATQWWCPVTRKPVRIQATCTKLTVKCPEAHNKASTSRYLGSQG